MTTRFAQLTTALCLAATLCACTPAAHTTATNGEAQSVKRVTQTIIVKPRQDVEDEASLMRLIRIKFPAPDRIEFLRAMSGGAYVLAVVGAADSKHVQTIITDLVATDLFEYVELDPMMTINDGEITLCCRPR